MPKDGLVVSNVEVVDVVVAGPPVKFIINFLTKKLQLTNRK